MRKEYLSCEEIVRCFSCQFFDSSYVLRGKFIASKLLDEFVVIDFFIGGTAHCVWVNNKVIFLY